MDPGAFPVGIESLEMLCLIVLTHYPTQNRSALLLEMLCLIVLTHYPAQNRSALLLEMLYLVV
ncbi:hypothetical protein F9K73_16190 [Brucella intermedia]|nr:hypothetical protein F9K73_16190 [Brucella intermedia]